MIVKNCFDRPVTRYCVYVDAGRYDRVEQNQFNFNSYAINLFSYGVYLKNTTSFSVRDNTFRNFYLGTFSLNSGVAGGEIGYKTTGNLYVNNFRSVVTGGSNPALRIRCNTTDRQNSSYYFVNFQNQTGTLAQQGNIGLAWA